MIIALNIVLAAIVIVGIVGMLARSIDKPAGAPTGLVRSARRRRGSTARAQFIGQTVEHRA